MSVSCANHYLIVAMHGWEHPRHAIKKFESAFSWVYGADTDVLINSHYIHAI